MTSYSRAEEFRMQSYLVWLEDQLKPLSCRNAVAFACSCCERLYPGFESYRRSRSTSVELRRIIDELWEYVLKSSMPTARADELVARLKTVELQEDAPHFQDAVDAVDATWCAIDAFRFDPASNAAKAAERCLDRIDRIIQDEVLGDDSCVLTPSELQQVTATVRGHSLFQAELDKQERDLQFLQDQEITSRNFIADFLNA